MKSLLRNTYYLSKPWVPQSLRLGFRRWLGHRRRLAFGDRWPIKPGTERPPAGWPGWPGGKQFALVLTHDVEGELGVSRCQEVARLEAELGLRSSFYFVPEGSYTAPAVLRADLTAKGFEVGLHDLKHDGKLLLSRRGFRAKAPRINQHLKDWKAVGFRAAFMLHHLDWFKELEVEYDASTFDVDPFEPQPDGVDTVFPFWVWRNDHRGYVELPYTLPQDFTVFILLGEKGPDLWKRKLDWLAAHGGMAMVTTHPDYMAPSGATPGATEFPIDFYREFLEYALSKHGGTFWNALPREVAQFVATTIALKPKAAVACPPRCATATSVRPKIWIDLDNTPHVPFFEPIIEELQRRGYAVMVTARDAFQVCDLADQKGLRYTRVGRHSGKNPVRKLTGLFYRALQLMPHALREKPMLGLSHGSRSQIILCNLLRLPTVMLTDYEHAKLLPLMRPTWELVPEVVPDSALYARRDHVRKYPGIKEDVYVSRLQVDPSLMTTLGLDLRDLIVTVRPPATEAHYHNPESEQLFVRFMERACHTDGVRVVLLPRNKKQGEFTQKHWPHWFAAGRAVIPQTAVDGLNLLWHSDLVVSGGGTMNREAAALGVPVYSIFRGKIGAVDHFLQQDGRLILVETIEDVDRKITLARRDKKLPSAVGASASLAKIVEHVENILKLHYPR